MGAKTVDNRTMPNICMQHMAAVMLIDGTATFKSIHDEARMKNADVLAIRSRVELRGDDALERALPSRQAIVEIRLKDGRKLRHHTENVRGSAPNPMTRAEVDAKSVGLMVPVLGKRRANALRDSVWNIATLKDMQALRPLLQL